MIGRTIIFIHKNAITKVGIVYGAKKSVTNSNIPHISDMCVMFHYAKMVHRLMSMMLLVGYISPNTTQTKI